MAALATLQSTTPGSAAAVVPYSAANAGDTVNGRTAAKIYIRNTDGSSHTVTFATPATVDGQAVANPAVVIAAGAEYFFTVTPDYVDSSGNVTLTYSAETGLKIVPLAA